MVTYQVGSQMIIDHYQGWGETVICKVGRQSFIIIRVEMRWLLLRLGVRWSLINIRVGVRQLFLR